jgi:hypothetical protein
VRRREAVHDKGPQKYICEEADDKQCGKREGSRVCDISTCRS